MATFTEPFDGVALAPEWTIAPGTDTPTVAVGVMFDPTGGVNSYSMTHSAVASGPTADVSIVVDLGDDVQLTIGLVSGADVVSASFLPEFSLLAVGSVGTQAFAGAGPLSGRHILRLTMDGTDTVATVATEADPDTAVYTATVATQAGAIAALAAGMSPVIAGDASDLTTYDDFTVTADSVSGSGDPDPDPAPTIITGAGMTFSITSLRYPDVEPVRLQRLVQWEDGEVEIPIDDIRSAKVTISVYDPACVDVLPLERMLHVRYLGNVVFWGPITDPEWDLPNGKVTINALGPEYRTQKHYVRVGDEIDSVLITITDPEVNCPVTGAGMWDLVLTAYNTTAQTARGVPDVGIDQGTLGGTPTDQSVKVARGDEVFGKIQQISKALLGPDFEFDPQEMDQGFYALLNTADKIGVDRSATMKWQYNWGQDNLDGYVERPSGSSVVTHRHTLSQDGKNRGTAAAEAPSARFGVWVEWDAIDGNPVGDDDDEKDAVLAGLGEGVVIAYGEPPAFIDVVLKPVIDGVPTFRYGVDFGVGDTIEASAHKGMYRRKWDARITKVTLQQTSSLRATQPTVELVPHILTADDVTGSDE